MNGLQGLLTDNNVKVFVSVALQPCAKTTAQYFVTDLKQSKKDTKDKMYFSIPALSDIYGTGNNSSRRYLAATEKNQKRLKVN